MSRIKSAFQYLSPTAASIAAAPAWTLIGTLVRNALDVFITSNSNASFEFSLDGVTPFAFFNANTATGYSTHLPLYSMGVVLAKNQQIFARRINAGVAGNLRITFVGSTLSTEP